MARLITFLMLPFVAFGTPHAQLATVPSGQRESQRHLHLGGHAHADTHRHEKGGEHGHGHSHSRMENDSGPDHGSHSPDFVVVPDPSRHDHDSDAVYLAAGDEYVPINRSIDATPIVRSVEAVARTICTRGTRLRPDGLRLTGEGLPLFLLHAALRL